MLNIFTDNYMETPTLNEDEHMYRVHTGNEMDNLYVITDLKGDELDEEVSFALRRKLGNNARLVDLEDVSCIYYETTLPAREDADDAWDESGYYLIGWSDGGMDWTNDGPVYCADKSDLVRELEAAYGDATETHLPYAEKVALFDMNDLEALLGDFVEDYDLDAIVNEATKFTFDGERYWIAEGDALNDIIEGCTKD